MSRHLSDYFRTWTLALVACAFAFTSISHGQQPPVAGAAGVEREAPAVAIFVKNRCPDIPDQKVMVLEDLVTARLADAGFRVISREDAINAVAAFADEGANAGDASLPGATVDKVMSNNTSALRLAQNLGAQYVLTCTLTAFAQDSANVNAFGMNQAVTSYQLTATTKMLDRLTGATVAGDVVHGNLKVPNANDSKAQVVDRLLDDVGEKLAASLTERRDAGRIAGVKMLPADESFSVRVVAADMQVPNVTRDDTGQYTVGEGAAFLSPLDVTVAIDGVVVGSSGQNLPALPGMHKIRLSRDGFKDWEQTVSVRAGQTLSVAMQLDGEGLARVKEMTRFLDGLSSGHKLSDAQIRAWEGLGTMLGQSGYRIDSTTAPSTSVILKD